MIKLIGIPFDGHSSFLKGPSQAPPRIRLMDSDGSANAYCEHGIAFRPGENYTDLGDLNFTSTDGVLVYQQIKERITQELQSNDPLLSLGGDHSISFPVIEAFAKKYPGLNVLHLDAHADLYQNFDNNPFSHASPFARLMEKGLLNSLTQVGIRTLNTHQKEQAALYGVKVVEMKDFNFDFLQTLQTPLYVSLDLDVLDPAFAPGISHHEPGGMSTRTLIQIIQSIPCSILGADIVEYNPVRDIHNATAMVAYKMMKELMWKMLT